MWCGFLWGHIVNWEAFLRWFSFPLVSAINPHQPQGRRFLLCLFSTPLKFIFPPLVLLPRQAADLWGCVIVSPLCKRSLWMYILPFVPGAKPSRPHSVQGLCYGLSWNQIVLQMREHFVLPIRMETMLQAKRMKRNCATSLPIWGGKLKRKRGSGVSPQHNSSPS